MFTARATGGVALALLLCGTGCAPGRHSVRVSDGGEVRSAVPRSRRPLAVPDEQFQKAIRALAIKLRAPADPEAFARQRFQMPIRASSYAFSPRTQQLRPLDEAALARELAPPELLEQARGYLSWCESIHKRGDCLQIVRTGGILDAHGRYALAMAIAQGATIEATKASLKGMANPDAVLAVLVSGMAMYMMLGPFRSPSPRASRR